MKDKLIQLRNTLCLIETKGESTIIMSDCVRFVDQLIMEIEKNTNETTE